MSVLTVAMLIAGIWMMLLAGSRGSSISAPPNTRRSVVVTDTKSSRKFVNTPGHYAAFGLEFILGGEPSFGTLFLLRRKPLA